MVKGPTTTTFVSNANPEETGDVSVFDLTPFMSMCCIITSCYTTFPQCLGAVSENSILCINQKLVLCKTSKESDAYCKCCLMDCDLAVPSTCCKVGFLHIFLNII